MKPYETMTETEKREQARLDVKGITVSGILACANSLLAHLKDVTPADHEALRKVYHDLHVIQGRVVLGVDVEAEDARTEARMRDYFRKNAKTFPFTK